jgi:hypothetical protein
MALPDGSTPEGKNAIKDASYTISPTLDPGVANRLLSDYNRR